MICGSVGLNFKSKLILITKKLDSKEYFKILIENNIIESFNERYGTFGYIFQQDGAKIPYLLLCYKITCFIITIMTKLLNFVYIHL